MKDLTFPAYRAGDLLTGRRGITEKQAQQIEEMRSRPLEGKGALTVNMKSELARLIEKRDAPPALSETAKSFVESIWLQKQYGYRDILTTKEILKGRLCEQDSISLLDEVYPLSVFRQTEKRGKEKENGFFRGRCDIDLPSYDMVEEIKTVWDLKIFFNIKDEKDLHTVQGNVYCDLYGRRSYALHYCLVDTPSDLIEKEAGKYAFLGRGTDEFVEVFDQLSRNHKVGHIPPNERVKTFVVERDDELLNELREMATIAKDYYNSLSLLCKQNLTQKKELV